MSTGDQPRVAKGTPRRGGQWSGKHTDEAGDVELVEDRRPSGTTAGGRSDPTALTESSASLEPDDSNLTFSIRTMGDGSIMESWRDQGGHLQDRSDGTPAVRQRNPDGTVDSEAHYQAGALQDLPDGSPAVCLAPPGRNGRVRGALSGR